MSKANTPLKVLRVAAKRIEKRWGKMSWSRKDNETGEYLVCLEGAITGGCAMPLTEAQRGAMAVIHTILDERYPEHHGSIPSFNDDHARTKDEVLEVVKLGIIRLETEALMDHYIDDEEVEELLG